MEALWIKGLAATSQSNWQTRAVWAMGADLLVFGAQENANSMDLYICDAKNMKWSGTELLGTGPSANASYYAIAANDEQLFVVYPEIQTGKLFKVEQSFASKV